MASPAQQVPDLSALRNIRSSARIATGGLATTFGGDGAARAEDVHRVANAGRDETSRSRDESYWAEDMWEDQGEASGEVSWRDDEGDPRDDCAQEEGEERHEEDDGEGLENARAAAAEARAACAGARAKMNGLVAELSTRRWR